MKKKNRTIFSQYTANLRISSPRISSNSRSLNPIANRRFLLIHRGAATFRIASIYSRLHTSQGCAVGGSFFSFQEAAQVVVECIYLDRIESTWTFSLSESPRSTNASMAPHFRFVVPCASAHGVREWCLTYRIPHVHMVVLPPCSQATLVDELVEFLTARHLRGVRSVAGECEL